MSKLLEGLARRMASEGSTSRRAFLSGRQASAVAATALAAPLAEAATASAREAPRSHGANAARPPRTPKRADLADIHLAFMHSAAKINNELLALLDAMTTPNPDTTFSPTTVAAIDALRATVGNLRAAVSKVKRRSDARTQILKFLASVDATFAALETMGASTDPNQVATLAAQIDADAKRAQGAYDAARSALLLPASAQPVTS